MKEDGLFGHTLEVGWILGEVLVLEYLPPYVAMERLHPAPGTGQRLARSMNCQMELPAAKRPKLKNSHAYDRPQSQQVRSRWPPANLTTPRALYTENTCPSCSQLRRADSSGLDTLGQQRPRRNPQSSGWRAAATQTTMQKLMRRTAQAERQVIRRSKKQGKMRKMALQRQDFKQRMAGTQEAHASLKDATRRRREDWEMGSLAPRRDTPLPDSSGAYWGSVSLSRNLADRIPEKQRDLACRWAGGRKTLCIKQGDRVAIMEGPDKGKISTIKYVQEEGAFVALEGEHLMVSFLLDLWCAAGTCCEANEG